MGELQRGSHGGVKNAVRAKLPTQLKTKKCSMCPLPMVTMIKTGHNDFRRLCQDHYDSWKRQQFTYSVKFERIGKIVD
jgi:hypothetical protein